jgi:hypothetical protein
VPVKLADGVRFNFDSPCRDCLRHDKLRESVIRTEPPGALVGSCSIIRQGLHDDELFVGNFGQARLIKTQVRLDHLRRQVNIAKRAQMLVLAARGLSN